MNRPARTKVTLVKFYGYSHKSVVGALCLRGITLGQGNLRTYPSLRVPTHGTSRHHPVDCLTHTRTFVRSQAAHHHHFTAPGCVTGVKTVLSPHQITVVNSKIYYQYVLTPPTILSLRVGDIIYFME